MEFLHGVKLSGGVGVYGIFRVCGFSVLGRYGLVQPENGGFNSFGCAIPAEGMNVEALIESL